MNAIYILGEGTDDLPSSLASSAGASPPAAAAAPPAAAEAPPAPPEGTEASLEEPEVIS
jgi:hypothetical protein